MIYPNNYLIIFIISILWEIFEVLLVNNALLYELTTTYWIIPEIYWNERIGNKIIDIMCNLSGYFIGTKINKNIDL